MIWGASPAQPSPAQPQSSPARGRVKFFSQAGPARGVLLILFGRNKVQNFIWHGPLSPAGVAIRDTLQGGGLPLCLFIEVFGNMYSIRVMHPLAAAERLDSGSAFHEWATCMYARIERCIVQEHIAKMRASVSAAPHRSQAA